MPALTPNRGYPYPVATDDNDVPGDLQRFAEAVDADLFTLVNAIPLRPAVRFRGTDPVAAVTFQPLNPGQTLSFDLVDFDTGLPYTVTTVEDGGTFIRPQLQGFYYIMGTVAVPRPTSGVNRNSLEVSLKNLIGVTYFGTSSQLQPSASDGIRTQYAAGGQFFNGTTDGVKLEFSSRLPTVGLDTYTVTERTLMLIRMSPV